MEDSISNLNNQVDMKDLIVKKIKEKFRRKEKDSVKYKTTFTTRMKNNERSESS